MKKWGELAVMVAALAVVATVLLGMYVTWRQCTDTGGATVRGPIGLECIK